MDSFILYLHTNIGEKESEDQNISARTSKINNNERTERKRVDYSHPLYFVRCTTNYGGGFPSLHLNRLYFSTTSF